MGANASAASLERLQHHQHQHHQYQHGQKYSHHGHHQHPQQYRRLSSCNLQAAELKHASSFMDLSTQMVQTNHNHTHNNQNLNCVNNPQQQQPQQHRMLLVNQSKSANNHNHNSAVASKIKQQQQHLRHQNLRKFSDSLPSLNQMALQPSSSAINYVNHHHQHHHHQGQMMPPKPAKVLPAIPSNKCANSNKQAKMVVQSPSKLVTSRYRLHQDHYHDDELASQASSSFGVWSPQSPQRIGHQEQHFAPNQVHYNNHSQAQNMKRTVSMSSLHNSNAQLQLHHQHMQPPGRLVHGQPHGQHHRYSAQVNHQRLGAHVSGVADVQQQHQQLDYHRIREPDMDLMRPVMAPPPPQRPLYACEAPKKVSKFKRIANATGLNQVARKYKPKGAQTGTPTQPACQVLPPLPRSQSLHELVQLRATENGQRMRTTGTLRGPLESGEPSAGNKVNVVVDMLESRRQQQQQPGEHHDVDYITNYSTMSTDDGIGQELDHHHQQQEQQPRDEQSNKSRLFARKQPPSNPNPRYSSPREAQESPSRVASQPQANNNNNNLKRSQSHSHLADNSSMSPEQDHDSGDDLNELARFLYQFKQRQATRMSTSSNANSNQQASSDQKHLLQAQQQHQVKVSNSSKSDMKQKQPSQQGEPQQQQSPNSTTSSSGFASSTGTSMSSGSGDGSVPRLSGHQKASGKQLVASKKKYPAPPRPTNQDTSINIKHQHQHQYQLKSGSSLLSIVDEQPSSDVNEASSIYSNSNHKPNEMQLDQLRRYSQLIQMSQSELALNHLQSTPACELLVQNSSRGSRLRSSTNESNSTSDGLGKHHQHHHQLANPNKLLSKLIKRVGGGSQRPEVAAKKPSNANTKAAIQVTSKHNRLLMSSQSQLQSNLGNNNNINKSNGVDKRDHQAARIHNEANYAKVRQQHNNSGNAKASNLNWMASESLCDLNFDCDLDILKNCGKSSDLPGGHSRANSIMSGQPSHDTTTTAATTNSNHSSNERRILLAGLARPLGKAAKQASAANKLSKAKLAGPTRATSMSSLLVGSSQSAVEYSAGGQHLGAKSGGPLGSKDPNWRLVASAATNSSSMTSSSAASKPSKAKGKPAKVVEPAKAAKQVSSRWQQAAQWLTGSSERSSKAKASSSIQSPKIVGLDSLGNEASELLNELDLSLDLVDTELRRDSTRRAIESYWAAASPSSANGNLDSYHDNYDEQDDDDDDEDDQRSSELEALMYQAMVSETFATSDTPSTRSASVAVKGRPGEVNGSNQIEHSSSSSNNNKASNKPKPPTTKQCQPQRQVASPKHHLSLHDDDNNDNDYKPASVASSNGKLTTTNNCPRCCHCSSNGNGSGNANANANGSGNGNGQVNVKANGHENGHSNSNANANLHNKNFLRNDDDQLGRLGDKLRPSRSSQQPQKQESRAPQTSNAKLCSMASSSDHQTDCVTSSSKLNNKLVASSKSSSAESAIPSYHFDEQSAAAAKTSKGYAKAMDVYSGQHKQKPKQHTNSPVAAGKCCNCNCNSSANPSSSSCSSQPRSSSAAAVAAAAKNLIGGQGYRDLAKTQLVAIPKAHCQDKGRPLSGHPNSPPPPPSPLEAQRQCKQALGWVRASFLSLSEDTCDTPATTTSDVVMQQKQFHGHQPQANSQSAYSSTRSSTILDTNFILQRKCPNAGLRGRC